MKSIKLNAILNVIQNLCKIIFPLISLRYASKILGAASYGKVSFGNSIVRYFILFSSLGISTYTQREAPALRDDRKNISVFSNEVFTINVISTTISYIGLAILLSCTQRLKDYSSLIFLQSISIILITLGADWINVIYEDYLYITVRYIIMQFVSILFLFVAVKTPSDYYIYAIVNILATAGGNIFNFVYIRRYVKLRLVNPLRCRRHIRAISVLFFASLTTVIYISSDITILGLYFTDKDVGIYSMAANVYSVIKQIISAVTVVGIPRLAYYLGNSMESEYKRLAQNIINTLITLLFPAISGLVFLSRSILEFMGGSEFLGGHYSLVILSFSLLFAILAGFYSNAYLLLAKKDNIYLFATASSAAINLILNLVLIPIYGIIGAAITTLIAEMVMAAISVYYTIRKNKIIAEKRTAASSVIGAIAVGTVCIIVRTLHLNPFVTVALSFFVSVVMYYFILSIMKNALIEPINKRILKMIDVNSHFDNRHNERR